MKHNKVGLVTFHNFNYGSALQCFASQEYLKGKNYNVKVIDMAIEFSLIKRYTRTLWDLLILCVSHPYSIKTIYSVFKSIRRSSLRITDESVAQISRFNYSYLNTGYYAQSALKKLSKRKDYIAFLSGSDQVWNVGRINLYDLYFLRFAPKEKRFSWAASFGGNAIAPYNKRRYARYIKDFKSISVRESSAVELVKNLTGRDAVCLADPVILLSADKWRELYTKYERQIVSDGKYILYFFLDNPSERAKNAAEQLSAQTGIKLVTFGYRQQGVDNHLDGGPWEFLSMIDHAEYVVTDSFHVTLLALLFHKSFFVYDRQYTHKQSQASRILDLLNMVNLSNRFEQGDLCLESIDYSEIEAFIESSRKAYEQYAESIFGAGMQKNDEDNNVSDTVKDYPSLCCGCGACADVCHAKAITMSADSSGHIYPHINIEKCTNCGACRKICAFEALPIKTKENIKGYIACCKNRELIGKSASGGLFASIAQSIIEKGGVVYGASLWIESGIVKCGHIPIKKIDDLYKIQGSKYVQSDTCGVFRKIKDDLESERLVLYGGTSCQVAALKKYLRKDYNNLITVDLICHGVPSLSLLQDYINCERKKYREEVVEFMFRVREGRDKPYLTTATTIDRFGNLKHHLTPFRKSAFYRMFMGRGGYRPSCYNCPFASINKPGDITLGDFCLYNYNIKDGGETIKEFFLNNELLSTLIIHTEKGQRVLDDISNKIVLMSQNVNMFVKGHEQLNTPSLPTIDGNSLFSVYKEKGFEGVQRVVTIRNMETFLPGKIRRFLQKNSYKK